MRAYIETEFRHSLIFDAAYAPTAQDGADHQLMSHRKNEKMGSERANPDFLFLRGRHGYGLLPVAFARAARRLAISGQ